jgi:hypothetical protein
VTSSIALKRALAASTALAVTGVGVTATTTPVFADPGNGKGKGHAHGQAEGKPSGRSTGHSNGHAKPADPGHRGAASKPSKPGKPETTPSKPAKPETRPETKPETRPETKPSKPQGGDPAGNNGTVKVTPHGEVDGIPQNTPHVGCVFDIEWYGFDEGDDIISQVTFEAWAPTRVPMTVDGPSEVLVGEDPASGAGTDSGFDGEATYRLSFDGEPHPQQGYHVKLTINTPGSQGADVKHKVFWVQACETPDTPDTPETPETPDTPDTPDTPEVEGEQEVDTSQEADSSQDQAAVEVLGQQATAPQTAPGTAVPSEVEAGLPSTDRDALTASSGAPLLALYGLVLTGLALVLRRTRRA